MTLSGSVGAVFINKETAPVAFVDEMTMADLSLRRFTISDSTKRYWVKIR